MKRGTLRTLCALGLLLLLTAPGASRARAESHVGHDGAGILRLAELVTEVRERNPEVQAARDRTRAMAAVPDQVSALDDPTLSYEAWNIPDSLRIDKADNNIFRRRRSSLFPASAGSRATSLCTRRSGRRTRRARSSSTSSPR